jgi:hypothetical protein
VPQDEIKNKNSKNKKQQTKNEQGTGEIERANFCVHTQLIWVICWKQIVAIE